MKNLLLGALLLVSSLQAMSLREIIDSSLQGSPSLEAITARLEAKRQTVEIADNFDNPELFMTKNTLDNSQAMSQTLLSFKQKIPTYSKRQKRQAVAIADEKVLQEELHAAKVKLVERIKAEAYSLWELRERQRIIDEYTTLTQQNIRLYESYTSSSESEHMGIMKAQLSLSDLKVQKRALDAKIAAAYARLSYLAATEVSHLELDLQMGSQPDLQKLTDKVSENNPDLRIIHQTLQKQHAKLTLAEINNYPDITLLGSYAYRESYENYFNVGIALSLPIYGTEDAKEERERALLLAQKSQESDISLQITSQLRVYYAQMLSAYKIYHIITDDALPQIAHMFALSSSSVATGSDLFKYIDILFQKLELEKKSIEAIANYKMAEAKIAALQGDLQ